MSSKDMNKGNLLKLGLGNNVVLVFRAIGYVYLY